MQGEKGNKSIIFFCLISIVWVSCKKNIPLPTATNTTPQDFSQAFEDFWNGMNTNYVYWDIDTTDWDAMYKKYKPIFGQLNLQNNGDLVKSISYFREMTRGLIDGHYNIGFFPSPIVDSFLFPASDRKKMNPDFHSPFSYIGIDSNYLDKGFVSGTYLASDNTQMLAVCGIVKNSLLYFYCSRFYLSEAYNSGTSNGVKETVQYFISQLQNLPSTIKGLIIDVRNNSGGNVEDLNFVVGRFINIPLRFGYTHYKSGNGRLAYTPWVDAIINPQPGAKILQVPIVVLADNYSISLAEAVTMAIRTLPNSSFVGESTWGATGPITNNFVYNDGQFDIPGFLSVYTSSAAFKYIDGNRYENKGFPPDIHIPFNLTALLSGDDPQFDKAISLIH